MKCLVFSDSHNNSFFMKRAISMHPDAEVVFFLGDGLSDIDDIYTSFPNMKFLAVRGNCDHSGIALGAMIPKTESITLEGKRITYTHGDLYGVKYSSDGIEQLAKKTSSDIILFGHTHTPFLKYIPGQDFSDDEIIKKYESGISPDKPFYLFNPGSIGSSYTPSYGVITLGKGEPLLSHGNFL